MVFGKGGKQKKTISSALTLTKKERKEEREKKLVAKKDNNASLSLKPPPPVASDADCLTNVDVNDKKPRAKIMTMEERKQLGLMAIKEQEKRTYVKVAYAIRFNEPDESEWAQHVTTLKKEIGMRSETIKAIFKLCRDGDDAPEKQRKGAGRKRKLEPDNQGLINGSIA